MKYIRIVVFLALGLLTSGCATEPDAPPMDPLEGMNRFFFDLNQRLDRHAALPAATAYSATVPLGVRRTLHNVIDNMGGPVTVANNILQIDFENAGIATARFVVNTTVGVAGIFDVATDWGLPGRPRDFGETMGTYGMPPGPYIVLPFRGSTDLRDFAGNYIDGYFTPLRYARYSGRQYIGLVRSTLGSVDNRSANIITYRDIERASVDFYSTMRTYYLQRRARQIEDRSVLTTELPDF
ncbi:MAG TPA: VacJ family lipoprotein [Rhizomicrobium sp.]|jgi:phospholipid-binding lipoprotein MlaA